MGRYYYEQRSNGMAIGVCVIIAALILIGGFIFYVEYNKGQIRDGVKEFNEGIESIAESKAAHYVFPAGSGLYRCNRCGAVKGYDYFLSSYCYGD